MLPLPSLRRRTLQSSIAINTAVVPPVPWRARVLDLTDSGGTDAAAFRAAALGQHASATDASFAVPAGTTRTVAFALPANTGAEPLSLLYKVNGSHAFTTAFRRSTDGGASWAAVSTSLLSPGGASANTFGGRLQAARCAPGPAGTRFEMAVTAPAGSAVTCVLGLHDENSPRPHPVALILGNSITVPVLTDAGLKAKFDALRAGHDFKFFNMARPSSSPAAELVEMVQPTLAAYPNLGHVIQGTNWGFGGAVNLPYDGASNNAASVQASVAQMDTVCGTTGGVGKRVWWAGNNHLGTWDRRLANNVPYNTQYVAEPYGPDGFLNPTEPRYARDLWGPGIMARADAFGQIRDRLLDPDTGTYWADWRGAVYHDPYAILDPDGTHPVGAATYTELRDVAGDGMWRRMLGLAAAPEPLYIDKKLAQAEAAVAAGTPLSRANRRKLGRMLEHTRDYNGVTGAFAPGALRTPAQAAALQTRFLRLDAVAGPAASRPAQPLGLPAAIGVPVDVPNNTVLFEMPAPPAGAERGLMPREGDFLLSPCRRYALRLKGGIAPAPRAWATGSTATLVVQDVDPEVSAYEVRTSVAANFVAATGAAWPSFAGTPSITGTPMLGQTVSANFAPATGASVAYTWLRVGMPNSQAQTGASNAIIPGATAATYALQAADEGFAVLCVAVAGNAAGKVVAWTPQTAAVSSAASAAPTAVALDTAWSALGVNQAYPNPDRAGERLMTDTPINSEHLIYRDITGLGASKREVVFRFRPTDLDGMTFRFDGPGAVGTVGYRFRMGDNTVVNSFVTGSGFVAHSGTLTNVAADPGLKEARLIVTVPSATWRPIIGMNKVAGTPSYAGTQQKASVASVVLSAPL